MTPYMVIFVGGEPKEEEREEHMAEWGKWIEELSKRGVYEGGYPYGEEAMHIKGGNANSYKASGNDGAGYMLLKVGSMDEAVKIAKDAPHMSKGGSVVIRSTTDMTGK